HINPKDPSDGLPFQPRLTFQCFRLTEPRSRARQHCICEALQNAGSPKPSPSSKRSCWLLHAPPRRTEHSLLLGAATMMAEAESYPGQAEPASALSLTSAVPSVSETRVAPLWSCAPSGHLRLRRCHPP